MPARLDSLEELRVFHQVVESGSITEASRALGMPANTVGRRLAALEARLGRPLLHRTTRSQSLSEAGRTLLSRVGRILEAVEATEHALSTEQEGLTGSVRVGIPSVLARDFFEAMAPLLLANPALGVEVALHDRPVSPVQAGLDVVVIGGPLPDSDLVARKLSDITFALVASQNYIARRGAPGSPDALGRHDTLHFRTGSPTLRWTLIDAAGQPVTVPVQARLEVDDGRALLDAVRSGLGIAMTSTRVLRREPTLVRVLPDHHLGKTPIHAIFPSAGKRSVRLQTVLDALSGTL